MLPLPFLPLACSGAAEHAYTQTTKVYTHVSNRKHKEVHAAKHPGREAGAARYGIAGRDLLVMLFFMPSTAYRYLTRIQGVRSGRTIIEGTRIGVHDVVGLVVNGTSVDEVCRSFPGVTRAQGYECLHYYEDHRGDGV